MHMNKKGRKIKKNEELNGTVSKMNKRNKNLESKINRQEQYSRRNCILIHEMTENKEENTDQQAIDINDNLDIKIDNIFIDRSHRIQRYDKAKEKARSVRVKFARYNVKGKMFREKLESKGTGKSITEIITTKRIGQIKDAREKYRFNNIWLYGAKILYKVDNEVKVNYD